MPVSYIFKVLARLSALENENIVKANCEQDNKPRPLFYQFLDIPEQVPQLMSLSPPLHSLLSLNNPFDSTG